MTKAIMKRWLPLCAVALALAGTACDPWDEEAGGAPRVVRVVATGGDPVDVNAPDAADGVWRFPTPLAAADYNTIVVQANKLLDGATIEATPQSCTPVGVTVTPAATPPAAWMTCYYPSSASEDVGGSIWIWQSADGTVDGDTGALAPGVYTITAPAGPTAVKDKQGAELPFTVQFTMQ